MKKSFFVAILSLVLAVMVIPAAASAVDYDPVEITGVHQIEGAGDSFGLAGALALLTAAALGAIAVVVIRRRED